MRPACCCSPRPSGDTGRPGRDEKRKRRDRGPVTVEEGRSSRRRSSWRPCRRQSRPGQGVAAPVVWVPRRGNSASPASSSSTGRSWAFPSGSRPGAATLLLWPSVGGRSDRVSRCDIKPESGRRGALPEDRMWVTGTGRRGPTPGSIPPDSPGMEWPRRPVAEVPPGLRVPSASSRGSVRRHGSQYNRQEKRWPPADGPLPWVKGTATVDTGTHVGRHRHQHHGQEAGAPCTGGGARTVAVSRPCGAARSPPSAPSSWWC
jgi:hypothetical protein